MTDCYFIGRDVYSGKVVFIEIPIAEEDLEANGITAIEDIIEAEFGMEIKNENYKVVAESTLKISY